MAANDLPMTLEARARRAYEWGRLRWSLRLVPPVLAASGVAVACGSSLSPTCALAAALLLLSLWLSFSGGAAGRAVMRGLLAGAVALACPVLLHTLGHACLGPSCMMLGIPSCIAGGAGAGLLIASRAAREKGGRFLLASVAVAGLLGALGCSLAGAAGVLGMLAGTVAAGAPALLAFRR